MSVKSPDFSPVESIPGHRAGGVLFLCDHANAALPAEYGDLGLPPQAFTRHIAYDIGAAEMVRHLANIFNAPAILTTFSRLLIDPNRGEDDPTLVMRLSDGAIIPGNADAGPAEIARRIAHFWHPYRRAVKLELDAMLATGVVPAIISMHSFTPAWKNVRRPWHVTALWDNDPRLPLPFIEIMRRDPDLVIGDNEPYDGALEGDTMDEHCTRRGLANLLIEVRQDLIGTPHQARAWAERLAGPMREALARRGVHEVQFHGSRTRGATSSNACGNLP